MSDKKLTYSIQFYSYWHTSSGLSAGTAANLTVIKHPHTGLPVIKGRTLKGMLRDAAYHIHSFHKSLVSSAFIDKVFGVGQDNQEGSGLNKPTIDRGSQCFFSDAELSAGLSYKLGNDSFAGLLYSTLSSTAIKDSGLAKRGTLRTLEVTIPLTLYATIDHFPAEHEAELKRCFQWIKRMGLNRHRGLGRCKFTIKND